eukprot:IDg21387t1
MSCYKQSLHITPNVLELTTCCRRRFYSEFEAQWNIAASAGRARKSSHKFVEHVTVQSRFAENSAFLLKKSTENNSQAM